MNPGKVSLQRDRALRALESGPKTSLEVSNLSNVSLVAATAVLSALKAAGLIRRRGTVRAVGANRQVYLWELIPGVRRAREKAGQSNRLCRICGLKFAQEHGLCRTCSRGEGDRLTTRERQTKEARTSASTRVVTERAEKPALVRTVRDDRTGRTIDYEVVWNGTDETVWGKDLRHEWPQRRSETTDGTGGT